MSPLISVVMPVFNAENFLPNSLQSIGAQTLTDLEIILVDDGSTDGSANMLRSFQESDPRARLIVQERAGVAVALNRGCAEARGTFIARMDADDIALPRRLEIQARFLMTSPEIDVLGTAITTIDANGAVIGRKRFPARPHAIARAIYSGDHAIAHSSVMMRQDAFLASGGYDPRFENAEDYELWLRMLARHRFANLRDVLLQYRVHSAAMSESRRLRQALLARAARAMHQREGAATRPGPGQIDWINLDRLGLDESDRRSLLSDIAATAMRCFQHPHPRSKTELNAAAEALFAPIEPPRCPLALAEATLGRLAAADVRDARTAQSMASLARALAREGQWSRAARWCWAAAAAHPLGAFGLGAIAARFARSRVHRLLRRG